MKRRSGLKTFVITTEICLLSAAFFSGAQCFQWHLKPPSQTVVESGKNVTILWGYTLDEGEKRIQLLIYLNKNDDENPIATIINHNTYKGKAYNNKTMITSRNSTVSMVIFFVTKQNIRQEYCASFSGFKGGSAINQLSCTSLLVYERPRITYRTPNIATNISRIVELRCNASGDPRPSIVWIKIAADKRRRHYSNSLNTTFKVTTRETLGNYCCIAANKYGNDTGCTNVNIGDKPMLLNTTPVFYTMTNSSVPIACHATGNPTPMITWTSSDFISKFISQSSDGNYTVPFKSCINRTLVFYCQAFNLIGETPRKKVIVIVNSLAQCNNTNIDSKEPQVPSHTNTFTTVHIIIVVVVCLIVGVIILVGLLALKYNLKKKEKKQHNSEGIYAPGIKSQNQLPKQKSKFIEESPYGEPIDCIKSPVKTSPVHVTVHSREFKIRKPEQKSPIMEENPYGEPIDSIGSPLKTNTSNKYASAEEVGIKGKKRNKTPGVEDNTSRLEKKLSMRIGKNGKKDKNKLQGTPTPLYEELSTQKDTVT